MLRTLLVAAIAAATIQAGADQALDEVLARTAQYVADYQKRLSGIVAEEHYRQNVTNTTRGGRSSRQFRELRSDLLMVKLPGEDWFIQFRDVFEVDRKAIRDRDQRLYKLFVESTTAARAQAEKIQAESARYNIGPIERTINVPMLALLFFDPIHQSRVTFGRGEAGNVKRFAGLAEAADIWMVTFKETGPGTLVRGVRNRDLFSYGKAWIDTRTGRILRSEMVTGDIDLRANIDVTYKSEPGLDLLVPGEMRESYLLRVNQSRIDGRATYGRFRQFTVTTTEKPKQ